MSAIATETFDGVTAPAIPSGYTAAAGLITTTTDFYSAPNGCRVNATASGTVGGYLSSDASDTNSGDVETFIYIKTAAGTYNEGRVYARAATGNLATGDSYYAVLSNDGVLHLYKRVSGVQTAIDSGGVSGLANGVWYRMGISCKGTAIYAVLRRDSDRKWLNSGGSWTTSFARAITATDSSVTGAGRYGLSIYRDGTPETYADNLVCQTYSSALFPEEIAPFYPITFADQSSITPAAEPLSVGAVVWTKLQQIKTQTMVSPASVLFDQDFTSGTTENWTKVAGGGATGAFGSNKYTLSLPTGGSGSLDCITAGIPIAPFMVARADVVTMPTAPAGASFCRIMVGFAVDETHHVLGYYDSVGTPSIRIESRSGATATTEGTFNLAEAIQAPFTIYYVQTGTGGSVYIDTGNGPMRILSVTLTASTLDLTTTATLASYGATFTGKADATGTSTISLTRFQSGYLGSVGISDHWWVRNLDGSPYTTGGGTVAYFTADQAGLSALSGLDAFANTHCGVYSIDLTTLAITEVGKIFFSRNSHLYGDAATQILWDAGNSRWSVLHGSYGDWAANHFLDVLYATSASDLTSGAHVLTDTSTITQPLGTSIIDFDSIQIAGQMYLACTPTSVRDISGSFDTQKALYSCTLTYGSLTEVYRDAAPSPFQEGPRFFQLNGADWFWGMSENYSGISLAHTVGASPTITDMLGSDTDVYFICAIAPFLISGTRRYVRLAFDHFGESTNGAGPANSYGGMLIYQARGTPVASGVVPAINYYTRFIGGM